MPSSASRPPQLYAPSLHDALPISAAGAAARPKAAWPGTCPRSRWPLRRCASARRCRSAGRGCAHGRAGRSPASTPVRPAHPVPCWRSEEHTSELQSRGHLVCRLLLLAPPSSTLLPYTTLFRSPPLVPLLVRRRRGQELVHDRGGLFDGVHPRADADQLGVVVLTGELGDLRLPRQCGPRTRYLVGDRKSTRLNSSHVAISYAVFCFSPPPALRSFPTRRSSDLRRWCRCSSEGGVARNLSTIAVASSTVCIRAPMPISWAWLCSRASWAISGFHASAARAPGTLLEIGRAHV